MTDNVMSLEETIAYHLEYNHAVPFPIAYIPKLVPICIQAINEINNYNLHTPIELPEGMHWTNPITLVNSPFAPAYEIVRLCHLTDWLSENWKMPEDK